MSHSEKLETRTALRKSRWRGERQKVGTGIVYPTCGDCVGGQGSGDGQSYLGKPQQWNLSCDGGSSSWGLHDDDHRHGFP